MIYFLNYINIPNNIPMNLSLKFEIASDWYLEALSTTPVAMLYKLIKFRYRYIIIHIFISDMFDNS